MIQLCLTLQNELSNGRKRQNYLVEVLNQSKETILGSVIQNAVFNKIIAHRLKSLNSIAFLQFCF